MSYYLFEFSYLLWGGNDHYSHVIEEGTEAQQGVMCDLPKDSRQSVFKCLPNPRPIATGWHVASYR